MKIKSSGVQKVYGLTGKYCAGKNLAGRLLEEAGCLVIDVDKLGHYVLEKEKQTIVGRFGSGILAPDGKIDRSKLGAIVFSDRRALKELEAIVHPGAVARTREIIKENSQKTPGQVVIINAALLFPSGLYRDCSRVLWVWAPLLVRLRRGRQRDKLNAIAVLKRIFSQKKLSLQLWKKHADIYTVSNPGSEESLARELMCFFESEGLLD